MSKVVRIPESVFQRLQKLATPLVDTPANVIERLLDYYDSQENAGVSAINLSAGQVPANSADSVRHPKFAADPSSRASRQRGVIVKVEGQTLTARSIADLYSQILRLVCDDGHIMKVTSHLPLATSSKRYLIATHPVHPNGAQFVIPVEYHGYYMEAHKDYKNGINHLRKLLDLCGLSMAYIG